ncbi:MAG: 16S rRNA (adenine(1518)-N(6)/adenine(1519)-N(6))-dimethyltransferase RsmA [Myxococcaceae bacterium]
MAPVSESPKELLARYHLKPKHSWGQNFLGDPGVLARIASTARVGPGDAVLELGAGLGHLTRALAATGAAVTAVERDRELVGVLEASPLEGVRIVAANAADLQFANAAGKAPLVLVGNLPYHLTSPILFGVLDQHADVTRAVFTVQKEVGERLAAPPGSRDYGLLSVLLGLHFDVEVAFALSKGLFHPPPKVESVVVVLEHRNSPRAAVRSEARFRRLVKAGFGQRRKTLLNALRGHAELGGEAAIVSALEVASVDGRRRAETLSVEEFAALERALGPWSK